MPLAPIRSDVANVSGLAQDQRLNGVAELKDLRARVQEASHFIMAATSLRPRVGLILGSGLGGVADEVSAADVIPYAKVPNFPKLTVEGHAGELIIGELEGWPMAAMRGRPHFYEGYSMEEVAFPVRVLCEIGCEILLVTNAAGGLNPAFQVGDLMLIADHINLPGMVGFNPLVGEKCGHAPRFVSMGHAYDHDLAELAYAAARGLGMHVKKGVYVMVGGPSYETLAEQRFLRATGADAVGMSTAPEVVVARQCSMRVLGISCITNLATGQEIGFTAKSVSRVPDQSSEQDGGASEMRVEEVTHCDVIAQGRTIAPRLAALIRGFLRLLPRDGPGR